MHSARILLLALSACASQAPPRVLAPIASSVPETKAAAPDFPGRVVFSSAPDGPTQTQFDVGEPLYAAVSLDAPMRAEEGVNLVGTVAVEIATENSTSDCMHANLHGDAPWEARVLAALTFSVDVVRPPFPSRVRDPDVRYDARCLEEYEDHVLAGESMKITVRVAASTWEGRVSKTLAVGTVSIHAKDSAHRLAALYRGFADVAVFPKSEVPEWDAAALDATRAFAHDKETTNYDPIAVTLTRPKFGGFSGAVMFRRTNGTCFVQPGMVFDDNHIEKLKCESDAEVQAVRAAVNAITSTPEIEEAAARWEASRIDRERARVLYDEHQLISAADFERQVAANAKDLSDLQALVPTTKHLVFGGACGDALHLHGWPEHYTRNVRTRPPRTYEISCQGAP